MIGLLRETQANTKSMNKDESFSFVFVLKEQNKSCYNQQAYKENFNIENLFQVILLYHNFG